MEPSPQRNKTPGSHRDRPRRRDELLARALEQEYASRRRELERLFAS